MKAHTRRRALAIRDSLVGVLAAAFIMGLLGAAPATAQSFPPDSTVRATVEEVVSSGTATGLVVGLLDADGSRRVIAYGDPGPDALQKREGDHAARPDDASPRSPDAAREHGGPSGQSVGRLHGATTMT